MGKGQKELARLKALQKSAEQIEFERKIRLQRIKVEKICFERELAFKQHELDSEEIIETIVPDNGQLVSGFKDNVKPPFLILNDIDKIKQALSEKDEIINELEAKNVRETTGTEGKTSN